MSMLQHQTILIFVALALSGCTSTADRLCATLNERADQELRQDVVAPFFIHQTAYPADWRLLQHNGTQYLWAKADSRQVILEQKQKYYQLEILTFGMGMMHQEPYRVRVAASDCSDRSHNITLRFMNYDVQAPASFSFVRKVALTGNDNNVLIARIACGLESIPMRTSDEKAAIEWKNCRNKH